MRRALRIVRTLLLATIAVALLAAAGLWAFTTTDRFRGILRDRVVAATRDVIPGELRIGAIEGSIWSDVTIRGVELHHAGRRPIALEALRLRFSIASLFGGRFVVDEVALVDADVEIRQTEAGTWDLVDALVVPAPEDALVEEESPSAGIPIAIAIDAIVVRRGRIVVVPAGPEERPIEIGELELRASADLAGRETEVEVESIALRLRAPDMPALTLAGGLRYADTGESRSIEIPSLDVRTERSHLALEGRVANLAEPDLDLTLRIAPLAAADLAVLSPAVRLRRDLEGTVALAGRLAALRATAELRAGDGRLAASGTADVSGPSPRLDARLEAARLDLGSTVEEEGLAGVVDARAEFAGALDALESARAKLSLSIEGLAASGYRVGRVALEGAIENAQASISGSVHGATGRATLEGKAAIAGAETYAATIDVERLELRQIVRDAGVPAGRLQGRLRVEGRGYALESASAKADLALGPSTVGDTAVGQATLAATLDGGEAKGSLRVVELRSGENRLGSAEVDFVAREIASPAPSAEASVRVRSISAGPEIRSADAEVTFRQGKPQLATLALRVTDASSREHRLRAEAEIGPDPIRVRLDELALELVDGTWALAGPSTIVRSGPSVTIDELRLVSGTRSVSVAGQAGEQGPQDLRLAVGGVELASLKPFLPKPFDVAGAFRADVSLTGTATAPVVLASASIAGLRVEGQTYDGVDAELRFENRAAALEVEFRQDATHRLNARGTMPVDVHWEPAFVAEPLGPIDAEARSDGLSLAFLNAFGAGRFSGLEGELFLEAKARGPIENLEPSGRIGLRGGKVRILPLGLPVRDVEIAVALDPSAIVLERFAARAKKGSLEASGRVALRDFAPASVGLELTLDEWPAIETAEYEAYVGGSVRAEGPLTALAVTGSFDVLRGTLRPDLAFLGNQPPKRDETIVVVGGPNPTPPPAPEPAAAADAETAAPDLDVYREARVDVIVRIAGNTWVKQEGTSIELRGEVRAKKEPRQDLGVHGRIETVRGWANFQGKRFRITRGEVVLTGGQEIDPRLDVVAEHRAGEYTVQIAVTGSASKPELELRSDPRLEQADILAVLLFGRPTSALSEGEKSSLSDQAAGLAASFAVAEVSREVTRALGIEELGVQIEEISAERVAVGAYVAENTFVTVAQDVGGEGGREVAIEYEFLPPNWSIVTSTNTTGESGGDVIWKKRY